MLVVFVMSVMFGVFVFVGRDEYQVANYKISDKARQSARH